ncbi:hypothetical protein BJY52DRAFT_121937 [Lactarius psammicola]|nr:hypothetical protein BJY52DRAFT_121937 [Lactarius psammicola]
MGPITNTLHRDVVYVDHMMNLTSFSATVTLTFTLSLITRTLLLTSVWASMSRIVSSAPTGLSPTLVGVSKALVGLFLVMFQCHIKNDLKMVYGEIVVGGVGIDALMIEVMRVTEVSSYLNTQK